jgi:orotate phosphoribosyltransferase
MERGQGDKSAVQEVREQYGLPVVAVANLMDLIGYLKTDTEWSERLNAVSKYREQYGV